MDTHTNGEDFVKIKAETGVTLLQAKKHQLTTMEEFQLTTMEELQLTTMEEEGHGTDSSSQPSEGTNPVNTLILDLWSPEL